MAKAIFVPYQEPGHLNATFKLAKALRARGHQIYYAGMADFEEEVRRQGFDFIAIFDDLFPKGTRDSHAAVSRMPMGMGILRETAKQFRKVEALAWRVGKGELDYLFERINPHLVIVDSMISFVALIAYKNRVPVALLSTTLPRRREANIPPLITTIIPLSDPFSKLRITLAWWKIYLENFLRRALLASLGMCQICLFRSLTKKLARAAGFPSKKIDNRVEFGLPFLRLPELIPCHEDFDFPRPHNPERFYIGDSVDFNRIEDAGSFTWAQVSRDKPLVYCSFGSQTHEYDLSDKFFRKVIEAFTLMPERQLIVSIGRQTDKSLFTSLPPNVLLLNWAPQLAILRRASLMIGNGSFNSVRECICLDVPMVLFPFTRNHPGCAARVAYHGLGLVGDIRKVTAVQIKRLVETVCGDASFKTQVGVMRAKFQAMEDGEAAVRVIESLMAPADRESPAKRLQQLHTEGQANDYQRRKSQNLSRI